MRRSIFTSFIFIALNLISPAESFSQNVIEPRIDRPGGDYRSFQLSQPNPGICAQSCANDTQCKAWTYANPGVVATQAKCFLKNVVPQARPNNCCTSGLKTTAGNPKLTVVFKNTGFGAYEIYLIRGNNASKYIGGVAAGKSTLPIPTRAGDRWEFKIPNERVNERYTSTRAVSQMQKLNGYRLNAAEPPTSFIRKITGDLRRFVEGAENDASGVIDRVESNVEETARRLAREGANLSFDIQRQYGREINILLTYIESLVRDAPNISQIAKASLIRGNYAEVARLIRLESLAANLLGGPSQPRAPSINVAFSNNNQMRARFMPANLLMANARPTHSTKKPAANLLLAHNHTDVRASYVVTFSPIVGDISALFGGTYEAGIAWPLSSRSPPAFPYTAWSWSVGPSVGADVSVEVGVWFVNSLKEIGGDAHGVTFGASLKAGLTGTFWWEYDGAKFGRFLGLTVSPQFGASAEAEYVRGTTDLNP